ncbi:zinc-dependent alcohol dehydrogenase family protein [Paenibacillus hodogayensis]|uniref:Zinc-dependent alcohol dehydrogenase family protein n=1 Tax=Paenibacillus hodogayensis TaxID=279208 RepID=A0ABV5W6S5_9BACL
MEATRITYYEFGNPSDVLRVETGPVSRPGQGEVLVRMVLSPINPSDLIPITGAYAHRIGLPAVPGYEGIGVIEDTGPSVSRSLIGRRVLPLRGEGTWQQFVTAPAEYAVSVPDGLDDESAAQMYINPLTAWLVCTEALRLQPGGTVLVNACGSAIGRLFAQLAKLLGFRLIAVTRSGAYTAELLRLGAFAVVNTAETELRPAVMELTGGAGADAAVDSVGGAAGTTMACCLKPGAVFLSIGLLSGIPVNGAEIARQTQADVRLFHLRHWNRLAAPPVWQEAFRRLMALVLDGRLTLMPARVRYSLPDVKEAVRSAQSGGKNEGKVFLTLP